jgi:hypothetical protein
MPAPDVLELVQKHDPARGLPPASATARETLRRSIVTTPSAEPRRRASRPRGRIALAFAVLALALAAGGWALQSAVFDTSETVRDDFADVTATIPLPPGAAWQRPSLDQDALYGQRAALMLALGQASCAWLEYWSDGDSAQRAEALTGLRQVRAFMPLHAAGEPEDAGGYDAGSLRFFDGMIAEAEHGESATVEQYLAANCS